MIARLLALILVASTSVLASEWVSTADIVDQALGGLGAAKGDLRVLYRPAGIEAPQGDKTWQVRVLRGLDSPSPRTRVALSVNGRRVQTWVVAFRKKRTVRCFILNRDLPPGVLLRPEYLHQETRPWDGIGTPATKREDFLGRHTGKFLGKGNILRKRDLRILPVVQRGEHVLVKVERSELTISIAGVARRPGYPGKSFPLETPSGKTINVWVDYDGEVKPSEEVR